jgi:hypothetical protein
LIEIFSEFVDVSFESKDVLKRAIRGSSSETWPPDADAAIRADLKDAERQMRQLQSRIRLLAGPTVIDAAQRLRLAIREYHELLDVEQEAACARDAEMRRDLWYLRQDFINRGKEALALPRAWRKAPSTIPAEAMSDNP